MKGFILNSMVRDGVGGPEAGAISLIYAHLLKQFEQDYYQIHINQIGEGTEPDEIILKERKDKIHINIRYPALAGFKNRTSEEKNLFRLEVIHTALNRIADYEGKLDKQKLEEIKQHIIDNDFVYDIKLKKHPHPSKKPLIAYNIVQPLIDKFIFYVSLEINGEEVNRINIYEGGTSLYYYPMLFQKGKWKADTLILTGNRNEVETYLNMQTGEISRVNLTSYSEPPSYEMFRADISKLDKDKAVENWVHSLPPSIAAIVRQANN